VFKIFTSTFAPSTFGAKVEVKISMSSVCQKNVSLEHLNRLNQAFEWHAFAKANPTVMFYCHFLKLRNNKMDSLQHEK